MSAHARTDPVKKHEPRAALADEGRLVLEGAWIAQHAAAITHTLDAVRSQAAGTGTVAIDFSDVTRFDTMGALVLSQFRGDLEDLGAEVSINGRSEEQASFW